MTTSNNIPQDVGEPVPMKIEPTPAAAVAPYDSSADTLHHIMRIQELLHRVVREFLDRADWHDRSKLQGHEKPVFDRVTPKLKALTYGSPEYKASLEEMGPALKHHYDSNPGHHPEAHPNGINDMNLFDLVEMLIDWKAASERHDNGDLNDSLNINAKRFGIEPQLLRIMKNTAYYCGWRGSSNLFVHINLRYEPLSDEDRKEFEDFLGAHGCILRSGFDPVSEAEKSDIELLRNNLYCNGCHGFQYYISKRDGSGLDPDDADFLYSILQDKRSFPYLDHPDIRVENNKHRESGITNSRHFPHKWQHVYPDRRIAE